MNRRTLRTAFLATVPILTGYLVLGIGFGILLQAKGYGIWWALGMSVFIYAGSMQYLAIDLITGGATLLTAALTTLMVNARHLFYGISTVEKYADTGKMKPYLIFTLTDETYSVVCGAEPPADVDRRLYYSLVSLLDQLYWVCGCCTGSLLGSVLPFDTTGLDFALTALFVTVFTEQWMSAHDHTAALTGVAVSVVCLLIFGGDGFLIPSMIGITIVLTLMRKWRPRL